jgi:hypothetical protein
VGGILRGVVFGGGGRGRVCFGAIGGVEGGGYEEECWRDV